MLLIDVGNSAIKAQFWQQGQLRSSCRIRTGPGWKICFKNYLSGIAPVNCHYAGVPGTAIKQELWALLESHFAGNLHRMLPLKRAGRVVNAYPDPLGMGVDRWLALLGTAGLTDRDAIVVDAGSAITVDLLKADGRHLGGAILPGFRTSRERFMEILSVADFSHVDIDRLDSPGLTTEQCIHINHDLEDTGYLDRLIENWSAYLSRDAVLVLSGGDAAAIGQKPDRQTLMVPDLVFLGMRQQLELGG